jgi:hypothetical protein
MKKLSILSLLFILLSLVYCFPEADGAEWEYCGADMSHNFLYYDKASICYPDEKAKYVVSVWQKIIYDMGIINRVIETLGDKYADLKESLHLIEVNCDSKQALTRAIVYYDLKGNVIDSTFYKENRAWRLVSRGSQFEPLFRELCVRDKR